MTQQHTPEPWAIHEDASGDIFISGSDHTYITEIGNPDEDGAAADARRIVACVNACRGLPTDELEQKGLVAAVGNQLLELERQRDDWQKALGTVLATIPVAEIIRASGTVGDAVAYFTQLHQQRDELLAALKEVVICAEGAMNQANAAGAGWDIEFTLQVANELLAKAKGGAA